MMTERAGTFARQGKSFYLVTLAAKDGVIPKEWGKAPEPWPVTALNEAEALSQAQHFNPGYVAVKAERCPNMTPIEKFYRQLALAA